CTASAPTSPSRAPRPSRARAAPAAAAASTSARAAVRPGPTARRPSASRDWSPTSDAARWTPRCWRRWRMSTGCRPPRVRSA
ncbi:hypothetical protein EON03_14340, partial [Staphylococcus aureus]|nr:hypothetical protein [Staphylococcus aureus]